MLTSNDIHTRIARVFMEPSKRFADNRRPFLYLLRRDLSDLYGPEAEPPNPSVIKAPLLAALGVMVGFELLTKYWSGKYMKTSGEDVEEFLRLVSGISDREVKGLAQFRHA